MVGLELGLRRLMETIAFNSDHEKVGQVRFQRFIEGPEIPITQLRSARGGLYPLLAKLSITIDEYLATCGGKRVGSRRKRAGVAKLGVGIYYFDNTDI